MVKLCLTVVKLSLVPILVHKMFQKHQEGDITVYHFLSILSKTQETNLTKDRCNLLLNCNPSIPGKTEAVLRFGPSDVIIVL